MSPEARTNRCSCVLSADTHEQLQEIIVAHTKDSGHGLVRSFGPLSREGYRIFDEEDREVGFAVTLEGQMGPYILDIGMRQRMRNLFYLPSLNELHHFIWMENIRIDATGWGRRFKKEPEEERIYELLTREYIEALGEHLLGRVNALNPQNQVTVLETGAGSGRMSHFLREYLDSVRPNKVRIIATDSGADGLRRLFPVELLDYKEALRKYKPQIVITSHMPAEQDWTSDYRASKSLKEYILIGETEEGKCGSSATWDPRRYEADGFQRVNLDDVSKLQVEWEALYFLPSSTVSFRRIS